MTKIFRPSARFKKQFKRIPAEVEERLYKVLEMMQINEFDPLLKNHGLQGDYSDYRSINITGDWRLLYEKTMAGEYILIQIGTHSELYK